MVKQSRSAKFGSHQAGAARWPALKAEPIPEDEVVGMAGEAHIGVAVTSYLLAGPALFGGIAWLIGRALNLDWIVAIGVLAGLTLSMYVIWLRYGNPQSQPTAPSDGAR